MGISYSAPLVVGFLVEQSDFIDEEPTGQLRCDNGHEWPGGSFCSECGNALALVLRREPKPILAKLCELTEMTLDDVLQWYSDKWLHAVGAYCRDGRGHGGYVIGTRIECVQDHPYPRESASRVPAFGLSALTEQFATITKVRDGCGLTAPVKLYLSMHAG